jgi:AcrR family transcriptional regulator
VASRLPAAERRRQVLDAALERFGAAGYHATSMNDVAEAAGVTKPVLYQHFTSKHELYRAVLAEVGEQLRSAVAAGVATAGSPREQVTAGFAAWFRWVATERVGFSVLFAGESRRDEEFVREVARVEREMAQTVSSLIEVEGLSTEQRLLLGFGIVGLAETTSRRWLARDVDLSADELAQQVATLAWAGLRGVRVD